ncbi:Ti-type conjugative transfer relaxase TraA [Ochrobactrum sp. Sa2BUA5]|nr:Ti-type conjugative transfer relaxase TraA [Ochrobactrum gallinarum]
MAIYHLTLKNISAGKGQSAVAAIAYRRGAVIVNEATGERKDFSRKPHIAHTEFVIPPNAPGWVKALRALPDHLPSQKFWSQVEHANGRLNAHYADEIEIALPREFAIKHNVELVRAFVAEQLSTRGLVADWAYHDIPENPHVHILVQTRPLTETGFGPVAQPSGQDDGSVHRKAKGKIDYRRFGLGKFDLIPIRAGWATVLNRHLALQGLDIRMDHRSFKDQGLPLLPSDHIGVSATAIDRLGGISERVARNKAIALINEQRVLNNPELILEKLGQQQSVFSDRDIAGEVFRYTESREAYQQVKLRIGASEKLIAIRAPIYDCASNKEIQPALYTTQSVFETEYRLLDSVRKLAGKTTFYVPEKRLQQAQSAFERQTGYSLSEQQKAVLRYVSGARAIAAVVGFAGAGKSSVMHVIRQAYRANGCQIFGAALAGVAVDELRRASGIDSRTVCSWIVSWAKGKRLLKPGDVFILDEAGMVSSQQMLAITEQVRRADAKLILLGDHRQLQPIMSGAAFRGIAEELGYRELTGIRRQRRRQHRKASLLLATGKTNAALALYQRLGNFSYAATKTLSQDALIRDWTDCFRHGEDVLILCHRNSDVDRLNAKAREALKAHGALQNAFIVITEKGSKFFAIGDRVVCLRSDWKTGLRNGTNATITAYQAATGLMTITTQQGSRVQFSVGRYNAFDHGYAQTIHKSQGKTVRHTLVYLSKSMDAQLTYVALTRHRSGLHLYADREEFVDRAALQQALSRDRRKAVSFQHCHSQDYGDALRGFMQRRNIGTENDWRLALQKIITHWKNRLHLAGIRLKGVEEKLQAFIRRQQSCSTAQIALDNHRPIQRERRSSDASAPSRQAYLPMPDRVRQVAAHIKQAIDHADRVDTKTAQLSLWQTCRHAVSDGPQAQKVSCYLDALGALLLPSAAVASGPCFDRCRLKSLLSCFHERDRAQVESDWPAIYYLSRARLLVTQAEIAHVPVSQRAERPLIEACDASTVQSHQAERPLIPALIFEESVRDVASRLTVQDADLGELEQLARKNLAQCFRNPVAVADLLINHIRARGTLAPHQQALQRRPADFGDHLARTGILGWPSRQRIVAQASLRISVSALENYAQRFTQLMQSFMASELEFREKMRQPIADLSPRARDLLARVEVENQDLLALVMTTKGACAHREAQAFLAQIGARFGACNPVDGERFQRVAAMLEPQAAARLALRVKTAQSLHHLVAWQSRAERLHEDHCQQTDACQTIDL